MSPVMFVQLDTSISTPKMTKRTFGNLYFLYVRSKAKIEVLLQIYVCNRNSLQLIFGAKIEIDKK